MSIFWNRKPKHLTRHFLFRQEKLASHIGSGINRGGGRSFTFKGQDPATIRETFIPGDIVMTALRAGGRRRLGRVFFGRFVHQSIPVTTSYLKNKKMSFMALKIPIKLSIFCPGSIFEIAFIIKVSGIFPVSKVVTCRLNSYSSSGTLYPEDAARVRAEPCPRKGGALATRGLLPLSCRAVSSIMWVVAAFRLRGTDRSP